MVNEAIEMYEKSIAVPFTIHDNENVEKGTAMVLKSPMSVSKHSGIDERFIGIAAEEKVANDGTDSIGIKDDGYWKMQLSGSCGVGDLLCLGAAANDVYSPSSNVATSKENFVGNAMTSGGDNNTIIVKVHPLMISNIRGQNFGS